MSSDLPHCIVVGAPKAGTTTLCNALARHPDVFMAPKKETHYFNHHFDRGLDWYAGLFRGARTGQIVMEGTPDYAMSNHVDVAMDRMVALLPDVKLIYMVREPVARVESHYIQMLSNVRTVVPYEEAVRRWPEIVETSDYPMIMERLLAKVPEDRIQVLFLDDYAADKSGTHARVLEFLGLPPDGEGLAEMNAQERSHTRENQGIDGDFLAWLRRSRYYNRLNMMVPRGLIERGKHVLRKKIDVDGGLSPDVRARLEDRFRDGWAEFQRRYRASPDPRQE